MEKDDFITRRFIYKGDIGRQAEIQAALAEKGIDRKTLYMILKNFSINSDYAELLQSQYPDV